ncbi:sensor histidine kinase [Carboxylicivirga linearis]|uniref:histidine kinase n=1 Tax=Carboxylicivirga linearis TaxID=1628157 RepID=A0ABS5JYD3_9BACT|nr:HAMP domain-containing sensor histidine kinase [Carboxylicivirga linearis]MBS2099929.1 HAMP domain-containing histidine kinase [Carboxylicivirga linearis]
MLSITVDNIEKEFRSLTLNKGIVISFFVYLGYLVFYLFYSFKQFLPVSITIFVYLIIHGALYLFLKKGKYLLVRISFLILSVLFLVNLTFFIAGPKTGVHYFLLIFSLLALSMARPERLWISVLYFSVSLFFFAGAEFGFLPDMSIADYPEDLAYIIRVQCIISSFVIIYYVSYMFYRINIEKERHIVSQNNELYRVNEKLEQSQKEISLQNEQMRSLNDELIANIDIISKQKKELEVANSTKEKFFSIIAHDVKNPLSSIIGLTELLQLNVEDYPIEKMKEYLKVVHESANRIDVLLMNLLNWAKAQTGSIEANKLSFNLKEVIDTNQKLFCQNLNDKNIKLLNNCSANIPVVVDRYMIDTVIRNLISNAIKFTPSHGSITLQDEVSDDSLKLHIIDTGIGMDDQAIKDAFKNNKSISYGTNDERGMGLGLLICKEFLEMNNCLLQIESTPHKGSTFSILFSN